jgi:hypothetical protein
LHDARSQAEVATQNAAVPSSSIPVIVIHAPAEDAKDEALPPGLPSAFESASQIAQPAVPARPDLRAKWCSFQFDEYPSATNTGNWVPLPPPAVGTTNSRKPPPITCHPSKPKLETYFHPRNVPVLRWDNRISLSRQIACFAPDKLARDQTNFPELTIHVVIPTKLGDHLWRVDPLLIHRVGAPPINRTRYHKLTVHLERPHLTTTEERQQRIWAQIHLIVTLSQLKNVDLVVIWNVMYLYECDTQAYRHRAVDLQYPFLWDPMYHGERPRQRNTVHRVEMNMQQRPSNWYKRMRNKMKRR